jgi:hypothetical protein
MTWVKHISINRGTLMDAARVLKFIPDPFSELRWIVLARAYRKD